ncbi:MAG TPA: serine/threonine-protein kinase [Polyangia bacterium]|nr:serine/threonine-protein kinase [Polyangia bacterium]
MSERRHPGHAGPIRGPGSDDLLAEADRAERAGDAFAAALALRRHLDRRPDDTSARLRYARFLMGSGERVAARQSLETLSRGQPPGELRSRLDRLLAELDEADGLLSSAAERWERLLADDLDDPEARARLVRLRPAPAEPGLPLGERPSGGETLVSPEGVDALRYRLLREIGRGATATVYLARDEALELPVALKVLHPQLAGPRQSEALARFFRGARLAAGVRHPGVVAIYDVDDVARALAMEWIPGGTLRVRLRGHPGGLPADEIAESAGSLLSTLGLLHARGIVHGDLKPSNLLLRRPGALVLADFGAAALVGAGGESGGGTPLYLAPEQLRGAPRAPATDLYAAGAVLFEMAAGRPLRRHADLLRGDPGSGLPEAARALLEARVPELAPAIAALLDADPQRRLSRC